IRKRFGGSGFSFNQDDIDCIFQEVFLLILQGDKLLQLKDIETVASWLAVIASNKTVDFMRRKIKQNKRFVSELPEIKDNKFKEELNQRDSLELVEQLINSLSSKEKIVISFNLIENRTHREISGIVGIPVNTVSTIIARTKEKLKKELVRKGLKDL
ncbi:MAG: RNA polymerase sigma factor, partial [Candidatus Omnitrophica bacterium]|nr:RNA polymerase sigma factor [Candidatus Omnitrophota bacterium]